MDKVLRDFFDQFSTLYRSLILSHEAHHAADMHNVFFILLHYLNEIIANFNYFVGSFMGEDPQGEVYSPPIYKLPEDEWYYLNILTEGLPISTRLFRYMNYVATDNLYPYPNYLNRMKEKFIIDKEDEELWLLQKSNLPRKSAYDYGVGLYYEFKKKIYGVGFEDKFSIS